MTSAPHGDQIQLISAQTATVPLGIHPIPPEMPLFVLRGHAWRMNHHAIHSRGGELLRLRRLL